MTVERGIAGGAAGGSGASLLTIVGIVFVVLKLVGTITWSWWLVLLPFIVEFGVGVAVLFVVLVGSVGYLIFKNHKKAS